ncbi:tripartite tricarboxylate transporter substrate-binding protein [Brachybacterium huguangmaarense]|uniref:Tripartite tricarboxylate transporter substrate-binding protein n=1 Tax=Brachybacterium huguangmaarense TaxID=1652028 RepID=A0ABY6G108_9MICO|nr:tripartite tricarboxylate transporter substrate-binding protein [Brachybacterium huguangmaarense]UYG16874.1 tripartite tricarboxylate transporter substrate-binding protein [Brachybacterium huguangmaarense]
MTPSSSAPPPDSPASPPDDPGTAPIASTNPGRRTALKVLGGIVAAGAIGTATVGSFASASGGDDVRASLTLVAPAAAGGGWDAVAREMQQAQRAHSIVNNVQVLNMPGAGGTIALSNVVGLKGRPNTLLIGGTGLLAATIQYKSKTAFTDVTPLGILVEEYDAIVVPKDSPYQDLDSLLAAWREDTGAMPWTGGGSFDQLVVTDLAIKGGVDAGAITYISSDGGGEVIAALLNGTAHAASSGLPDTRDQIESGRLRALAIVAKERVDFLDVPTTVELGYDVTLSNWRSISAPPGLDPEDLATLNDVVTETIATPEWADAIKRYAWTENVIRGDDLTDFLADQETQIRKLYEEMGS